MFQEIARLVPLPDLCEFDERVSRQWGNLQTLTPQSYSPCEREPVLPLAILLFLTALPGR
eukprot:6491813-Amphidinium_carterae.1